MADLSEFLGTIVSSVSNARVHADLQTIRIAQEYAKDDLLQHFAIPRMRFNDIEIKIPAALESFSGNLPKQYEPVDIKKIATITYTEILRVLETDTLTPEISKRINLVIIENAKTLDKSLITTDSAVVVKDFSTKIATEVFAQINIIFKSLKRKALVGQDALLLQEKLIKALQVVLINEIKLKPRNWDQLQVIIEADRLRDMFILVIQVI